MSSVPKGPTQLNRSRLHSRRRASRSTVETNSLAPDIGFRLEQLASLQQSGTLVIVQPEATSTLVFDKGSLTIAEGGFGSARLGKILLEAEVLTETELIQELSTQRAERRQRPIGRMLVESGRIDRDGLKDAFEVQCHRVLDTVLSGTHARFQWLAGSWGDFNHLRHSVVPMNFPVEDLIRERLRP